MTTNEIHNIQTQVTDFLCNRRLRDAFALIKNTAESSMNYEITDRVKRLEQTYAYMLGYLTAGADDPHRERLLTDTVAETYEVLDCLVNRLLLPESPTLYYNIRRYRQRNGAASSLPAIVDRFKAAVRKASSLSGLYADASSNGSANANMLNSAERDLFNAVWTSFPLQAEHRHSLVDIVTDKNTSVSTALRLTSALGLATTEFADRQAIEALCDIYQRTAQDTSAKGRQIAAAALVGLVVTLYKYADRELFTSTRNHIESLRDMPSWSSDVKVVFMELVRSRDTQRISDTMNNQIIPEMMALRPEIEKKIRDTGVTPESMEDFEANPEWEDLLAKSGIGDKLRHLNELQMEGSDVFMSTFAHLKNFPFFNEVINWFTPMATDNPEVERMIDGNPALHDIVTLIQSVPFLCDSDKFSMLLSVNMLPDDQRQLMLGQISAQSEQLDQLRDEINGITHQDNRRADVRNYLRNLYRFVNLFRRKGEFYNIFEHDMNLLAVPILTTDLEDADLLRLVGEFYFKRAYYSDALKAFTALDRMNCFDATLYQKMGYAYEKTGRPDDAIRFYEQADLLDSSSRWLKIRLATMYRSVGRSYKAIELLNDLVKDNADDAEVELLLGYTYVRLEKYDLALKHFYKVEFLDENNPAGAVSSRAIRPVAWSLFMLGQFDKAATYYDRIPVDTLSGEDYLNMGHVALARQLFKDAVNNYKLYILAAGNDKEAFFKALETDRAHLTRVGVKDSTISLIADAMLYDLD